MKSRSINYDPESGRLWNTETGTEYVPNSVNGYIHIKVNGKVEYGHVIAYELHTGCKVPEGMFVDHKDRDKSNTKFNNLRLVSRSQNNLNRRCFSNNSLNQKGITYDAKKKLYRVRLSLGGKRYSFGRHKDLLSAIEARDAGLSKLHGKYACH